jgi:hypothetical protein
MRSNDMIDIMSTTLPDEIEVAFCNSCGQETRHQLLFQHIMPGEFQSQDGHFSVDWRTTYQVLGCLGCEDIHFRKRYWNSHDHGFESDIPYDDTHFPPRLARKRPEWLTDLPEVLKSVLIEMYSALGNDLKILATFGARTALDITITEMIGDIGSFEKKIKELVRLNLVSAEEELLVTTVIEAGSAAAHRGFQPDTKQVAVVIDILENLIERAYIHPLRLKHLTEQASQLRLSVPVKNIAQRKKP